MLTWKATRQLEGGCNACRVAPGRRDPAEKDVVYCVRLNSVVVRFCKACAEQLVRDLGKTVKP